MLHATFEVKQNLIITGRSDGKRRFRRAGHNIWLNLGREFIAQLMSYSLFSPLTPIRNDRIQYMGLGVGGTRQKIPSIANSTLFATDYPGTNVQTDQDPDVTQLERPVRISGSSSSPPYNAGDVWLGQVQAPPDLPAFNQVIFRRLFTRLEISYAPYDSVPVSEIGLFTSAANPLLPHNTCVAYDTFDSIPKTDAIDLEIEWTITL